MSDYEYAYDDSESDCSDCSDCSDGSYATDATDATGATGITCSSLEAALTAMTERIAELDSGLDSMATVAEGLEKPVIHVAVSSFMNPRFLESAPFRQTKFRLRSETKALLGASHHNVTFAELCEAICTSMIEKKEGLERLLEAMETMEAMEATKATETVDLLGVLKHIHVLVE